MDRWSFEPEMRLLQNLRSGVGRLFNEFLTSPGDLARGWSFERTFPALNVWEQGDSLFAECELPGVKEDDVEVSVVGKELTIKGQRQETEIEGSTLLRQEREFGQFHRVVKLPVSIDVENVKAELRDGVLTITLPKAPEAKPRKIDVKAGALR